jgi:crossover junction endodeoxyribonuclease RuvC
MISRRNLVALASRRAAGPFGFTAESSEDTSTEPDLEANVIDVDPGVARALTLVSRERDRAALDDMRTPRGGSGGRALANAPLLAELSAKRRSHEVICEFVSARLKEGAIGAFPFGRFITSPGWKRLLRLPAGREGAEDAARTKAIRRPDKAGLFARVSDDGRAEAALIAVAALLREGRQ